MDIEAESYNINSNDAAVEIDCEACKADFCSQALWPDTKRIDREHRWDCVCD